VRRQDRQKAKHIGKYQCFTDKPHEINVDILTLFTTQLPVFWLIGR